MIVITGNILCISLEENLYRFLKSLEWSDEHKCILKKNKTLIKIVESGKIVEYDSELKMDIEFCKIYDFYTTCKSCGKSNSFIFEED